MSLTLRDAITATQTTVDVNGADVITGGDVFQVDSEYLLVSGTPTPNPARSYQRVSFAERGTGGSAKASHLAGVALTAANAFAGGGGSDTRATVDLSVAQIRTLDTIPVEVVAAPGAGKVIWPKWMFLEYKHVSVAYDGGQMAVSFADSTYGVFVEAFILFNGVTSFVDGQPLSVYGRQDGVTTYANKALQFGCYIGSMGATGNGTARVTVDYEIVTLA